MYSYIKLSAQSHCITLYFGQFFLFIYNPSYTDGPLYPHVEIYWHHFGFVFYLSSAFIPSQLCTSQLKRTFESNSKIYLRYPMFCVCLSRWYFKPPCCLKPFLLKQHVRPYSHSQQVVVVLDSSPTGILPAVVVTVTNVQPPDIAFLCSQLCLVLCVE